MRLYAFDADTVRVRILEQYHPVRVSVSDSSDPGKAIVVNKRSVFPVEFKPSVHCLVRIHGQDVERSYTGNLLMEWDGSELLIVNTLPLEDYVASVVLSEMGWAAGEAMRAQAVLARTWAVTHRRKDQPYDFGDLTSSQVYKGLFPQSKATIRRLSETFGQVLVYNSEPIQVFYHAACSDRVFSAHEIWGGRQTPYLKSVALPRLLSKSRDNSSWERLLPKADIDALFRGEELANQPVIYKKTSKNGHLGIYVNNKWIGIDSFRIRINRALGWNQIRSNDFSMQTRAGKILFQGKGFGHLVGLCQQEAVILAGNGFNYTDILTLFYPGSEIMTGY